MEIKNIIQNTLRSKTLYEDSQIISLSNKKLKDYIIKENKIGNVFIEGFNLKKCNNYLVDTKTLITILSYLHNFTWYVNISSKDRNIILKSKNKVFGITNEIKFNTVLPHDSYKYSELGCEENLTQTFSEFSFDLNYINNFLKEYHNNKYTHIIINHRGLLCIFNDGAFLILAPRIVEY